MDNLEKTGKKAYTVCGVRDGILFRFLPDGVKDRQKQSAQACAMVEEKVKMLASLLQARATVYIEGVSMGELQRIALEQRLSVIVGRAVCVRTHARKLHKGKNEVHTGTMRGGMCLCADGDLTIVGDVHRGARLEAGGSIVVLGKLQGAAFAGMSGAEDAVVAAWRMKPQTLCIAHMQAACTEIFASKWPSIARVHNGEIVFSDYSDKI